MHIDICFNQNKYGTLNIMIIHIEEKTIYHLNSNFPIIVGEFRKQKIEKLVKEINTAALKLHQCSN
jgi:hypothetical protein